jgi:hypothetical protein
MGIKLDRNNARKHSERNKKAIRASLEAAKAARSIVLDSGENVLAGNGVAEQWEAMGGKVKIVETTGDELVAVKRVDVAPDSPQARQIAALDNLVADTSAFDYDANRLRAALANDPVAAAIAQEEKALRDLLRGNGNGAHDAEPQMDRAAELQEKWRTSLGQTWKLGEHTLYCGPASEAKIKCNLAIFDPPFDWGTDQQQTAVSWAIWETAILMGLEKCMPLAVRGDFWHWWIWDAGMNRFGGRGHNPVSGCCMVLLFGEHHWYESQGLSILDKYGIEHYEWPTQVVKIQDHLAGREYKHQKPIPLTDYIVALYSGEGETMGDLFAGSGSFLISAQNLNRQYCGAEILPENCAVILDRWSRAFPDMPPSLA